MASRFRGHAVTCSAILVTVLLVFVLPPPIWGQDNKVGAKHPDFLVVAPRAIDPQFREYPDGREQVVYTINCQYPAKSVLSFIEARLARLGWKPLRYHFWNPGIPSSRVRGWQEGTDMTQNPPTTVRGWGADWEDASHDILVYALLYRTPYPETTPPDLTSLQVMVLYLPSAVANKSRLATQRANQKH